MLYSTLFLSALSIGSAIATTDVVTTHAIQVGTTNGTIGYFPNNITASVGDIVQFHFVGGNHTVTQSAFDSPCVPLSQTSNSTGIFSGFMPVPANSTTVPTFSIEVATLGPQWFYCSQSPHCQGGMVMVINENTTANASRSITNFAALAKLAAKDLAPSVVSNVTISSSPASSSGAPAPSSTNSTNSTGSADKPSKAASSSSLKMQTLALGFAGVVGAGVMTLL